MAAGDRSAAIVFLFDPEAPRSPITDIVMSLYGLTPAEARLVELLVGGESVGDVAGVLGIGKQTARNHLQAAYRKTGTHRQGELVKLIQAGAAGAVLHGHPATRKQ